MFSILYVDIDFQFVFGFLCGVILMCAGYFIEKRQVRTAAGLFFTVAGLALLDFPYFIPVVVYIFLRDRQYVLGSYGHVPGNILFYTCKRIYTSVFLFRNVWGLTGCFAGKTDGTV